jgi:hypothetical protein
MKPAEPTKCAPIAPLVFKDKPTKVVAYVCQTCGTVYSDKLGTGQHDAERCPQCSEWTCEECGKPASAFQWYCHNCLSQQRGAHARKKLAEAEAVPAADYPDDQGVVWEGAYYHSLDELLDHCDDEGISAPDRVWATTRECFTLDDEDIVTDAWENWTDGCDGMELENVAGTEELAAAVEAFNQANEHLVIFFETTTAVDLSTKNLPTTS